MKIWSFSGEDLVIQKAEENILQMYEKISIVDKLCYSGVCNSFFWKNMYRKSCVASANVECWKSDDKIHTKSFFGQQSFT